jgi:threonine dehydrogenase-like Zn-dependent dehydrogenase
MWAQRLFAPFSFASIETATPTSADLAQGQVLLRTLAGGLCGSDLPYFRGQLPLPWGETLTSSLANLPGFPMHEVVGEVVASKASALEIGTTVVGWASQDNALAEFVVTESLGLAPYDVKLQPSTAVLLQPLACVLEAAERMGSMADRDVVILGLGPIGLLFGHVAKAMGARSVRGVDRVSRADLGPVFGFDETIHAATDNWVANLGDRDRPEVVVEAIGHQQATLTHAIESLAPEGLLYYFGIPDEANYTVPFQTQLRKNLTLMTGITIRKQTALRHANEYLCRHPGLAEDYITDRFKVSEATAAYALAAAPSVGRAKIVLEMT